MSGKMKAAVVHEFGKPLTLEELDIPSINTNQILVKMIACGVCHTDLHAASGDWPKKPTLPFIPGHEGVGTVVAVGSNVDWIKEGDVVGVPFLYSACGHCEHCFAGWETLCQKQEETGYSVNGCFAEYVVADPNYVAHIPAGVDPIKVAPVLCAGLTVYKGLKMTDTRAGDWVAVSGAGGLGQMAIQYGVAMGLNMIAVDIDDAKLETARKLGAVHTVNAKTTDPAAFMQKEVGGVHGGLITAVSTKAFSQAMGYVRAGGTLVLNGLPPGDFPISIFDMVMNAITIRGSIVGTRLDMIEALSFFAEGKVTSVTKTDRLENINNIFDDLKNGRVEGRVVLDFRN
ncbi:alcohol dehydrogenase AdhP [Acetobacter syzygii]|uniref:alcohol dehydrogenase n=1 Tax=Acetobacter syzygii TaxID=146476 RepID=A0A270BAA9_9PROT|nr:alcohol dehydrogenase AdhP [Acetobacter syzygii]PAL21954.1 zinc-dependent alcohol dehydrogenase [Acetobacter syzygii]PAL23906.1 zinc-dependent alcohol dehydrogenase [Acetobacter syzygii]GAN72295.1 alcohol dehydrogenase [Acetobacter syzygii]GBR66443.1 alcohol dehydrogenase [Acetobacter syzygii NRIC 0483]GEL56197.1 zinc-dependent alcohol dehydrogenase [Acetobacter syzygii]